MHGYGGVWRRHQMQRLALLCAGGTGLQAIASQFCATVTRLLDAEASFLMWFADDGRPLGFYHETAPAELKDLFTNGFEDNFSRTEPVSAWQLIEPGGPLIGRMLAPGMQERFEQGSIYRQLCVPLGHRYMIDMSASAAGIGHAGYFAWNPPGRPFNSEAIELLRPIQPLMQQALAAQGNAVRWLSTCPGSPHLIVNTDGTSLLAMDARADDILKCSQLLGEILPATRQSRHVPFFTRQLAEEVGRTGKAEMALAVADGRLLLTASPTNLTNRNSQIAESAVFIQVELQIAEIVAKIEYVAALDLTPLQREMTLFAMDGNRRLDCLARFQVSHEALKKHLRHIFRATDVKSWDDLRELDSAVWLPARLPR